MSMVNGILIEIAEVAYVVDGNYRLPPDAKVVSSNSPQSRIEKLYDYQFILIENLKEIRDKNQPLAV